MLRICIDYVEDGIRDRKESSTAEEKRVAVQNLQNSEARALPFITVCQNTIQKIHKIQDSNKEVHRDKTEILWSLRVAQKR